MQDVKRELRKLVVEYRTNPEVVKGIIPDDKLEAFKRTGQNGKMRCLIQAYTSSNTMTPRFHSLLTSPTHTQIPPGSEGTVPMTQTPQVSGSNPMATISSSGVQRLSNDIKSTRVKLRSISTLNPATEHRTM